VNLLQNGSHCPRALLFSGALFILFTLSELRIRRQRGEKRVGLDQFNLAQEAELTQDNLDSPGNILFPSAQTTRCTQWKQRCVEPNVEKPRSSSCTFKFCSAQVPAKVTLHRTKLFSTIEQSLFSKVLSLRKRRANRCGSRLRAMTSGGILRMRGLAVSSVVIGSSSKMSVTETGTPDRAAWERMSEPRPRVSLEIFNSSGQAQIFYLGPHAPRLTPKEIDLLHELWVNISEECGWGRKSITMTASISRSPKSRDRSPTGNATRFS